MKRILQVVSCLELGGTEAFIMNHYRNIDKTKYQYDFIVFQKRDWHYIKEIKNLGGNVFFSGSPSFRNLVKFKKCFFKIVDEHGPYDVIHCHVNTDNGWILKFAKKAGILVRISHSHSNPTESYTLLKMLYVKAQKGLIRNYATHYLACSNEAGEYLYGRRFFHRRGKVLHNGIDVQKFLFVPTEEKEKLSKELLIPADCSLIIGNITRFDENKNQLFMLAVFEEILKIDPAAILILGGPDGGALETVKKYIHSHHLNRNIRLIGKRTDIHVCLSLLDVYLFPSKAEGLGIAFLEAQASGRSCLVSDSVSCEGDMGIGLVSFISLSETPEKWAQQAICSKNRTESVSAEIIQQCFEANGFDITSSTAKLVEVYDGR